MLYIVSITSIIEVLVVVVPLLLVVAFVTVGERKTMASMQRRLGPNVVGFYGLLQAFADALKLLLKEYVSPTQANIFLFFLGPFITLIFSLLAFAVMPFAPGLAVIDFDLGILFFLAVSSLATYGILLAGWSANSKYAFLGSLRSTAQLISYELILSSCVLVVVLLTSSLNFTADTAAQKTVWFLLPLFSVFLMFFIAAVAETNRAPFDLAEAESELVSGFMTEHSAVIFVFFFLAEYASIVVMCIVISILFLAGFEVNFFLEDSVETLYSIWVYFVHVLTIAVKTSIMIFIFIWVRASFPRIRFDQLMSFCWTILLPLIFALILFFPCFMYMFIAFPTNVVFC